VLLPYMQQVAQQAVMEQQQQALLAAAKNFGGGAQESGKPGPVGQPQAPGAPPMVQGNELADETLAGAGGGANVGFQ
jgi:hypothetical protein